MADLVWMMNVLLTVNFTFVTDRKFRREKEVREFVVIFVNNHVDNL